MDSKDVKERNDKVKQWLWRYQEAKKDVRRFEAELQELIETQESTGAIEYSDMPKGGGGQSELSDYMVEREGLQQKIWDARYRQIVIFGEIHDAVEQLPSADEREVIVYRYIRLMRWDRIGEKMECDERQARRYHGNALIHFHEILKIHLMSGSKCGKV